VSAHPRTSELIERIRRRDGQVGVNLGNAPEEWVTLARELEGELSEAWRRLAIYAAEREHNAMKALEYKAELDHYVKIGLIVRRE
jgi:hypothetical protein